MNSTRFRLIARVAVPGLATAFLVVPGAPAIAQSIQHLNVPQPGGMPGWPVMTQVIRLTNGLSVTWDGPSGSYQLFQRPSLKSASWQAVGQATNLVRQATVTALSGSAFFRVSGPPPVYGSTNACAECHGSTLGTYLKTPHAQAYKTLATGPATSPGSLPSHTVGYGLPTGFRGAATTPQLGGVQCENCHGPAANHAANYIDMTVLPRVELAATVCGGCHTGTLHPYYNNWTTSAHAQVPGQGVIPDMNSTNNIDTCGRCHSASARLSLLNTEPLPVGDADMPVVCADCHDSHAEHTYTNVLNGVHTFVNNWPPPGVPLISVVISNNQLGAIYTNQLRNPLGSTNNYSVNDGTFTNQYNPNINLCAQCHNDRGDTWTNSSAPPHQSLQYNMLLGTVGVVTNSTPPYRPATHSQLEMQCAACHMQTASYQSAAQPAITGHSFNVQLYNVCAQCHVSAINASNLVVGVQGVFVDNIQVVQADLNLWAVTKAPAILGTTNYGTRAWEYTTPGELSPGGPGPTATLQNSIPVNIQKARFNLYSVLYDGSGGVHNPYYAFTLLSTADAWVQEELNNPSP